MIRFATLGFWLFLIIAAGMPSPAAASTESATAFVNKIGDQVLAVINDETLSEDVQKARLNALFAKTMDLDWIGKFVLGKHWRRASEAQKQEYLTYYRTFLTRTYTSKFRDYTGETFTILKARDEGEGKYLLTMEIIRQKEANILIDYKIRQNSAEFKIYDIVVEGVSLITTQRSEFSSVISRKGLDHLIKLLAKRVGG